MDDGAAASNPVKVRQGLVIISLVVVAAIVLVFVIDAPVGKAVMFAIAAVGVVRAFLLARALRASQ